MRFTLSLLEAPMSRFTKWIILLVVCGCAPVPVIVDTLNPDESLGKSENLILVTGRILQVEDGKEQNMHPPWYEYAPPTLALYRVENRQMYFSTTTADTYGNFYWLLPSGTYLIARYQFRGQSPIAPRTAFQVPPGQKGVYIGTLKIEVDTVNGFLFIGRARLGGERISVLDEYKQARSALEIRYPQVQLQLATKLMVHDLLLPALPRYGPINRQSLIGVLNELGFTVPAIEH